MFFISSPLEQFQILPIFNFTISNFDFSITNATIIISIGLISFTIILNLLLSKKGNFYLAPNRIQYVLEVIYGVIFGLLNDNVGPVGKSFFPYVFSLFVFILISNIIGLVPYSFTITSHLIVTFALALMTFVGINLICVREHGINILSLFLPSGSSIMLALLLVPIELVSYIFRPISLSVRLFANMMAGHTLLKVIAGFAWAMMFLSSDGDGFILFCIYSCVQFFPLVILVILMFLELAVAVIQAYVFTILTCIYLNDAIHLH